MKTASPQRCTPDRMASRRTRLEGVRQPGGQLINVHRRAQALLHHARRHCQCAPPCLSAAVRLQLDQLGVPLGHVQLHHGVQPQPRRGIQVDAAVDAKPALRADIRNVRRDAKMAQGRGPRAIWQEQKPRMHAPWPEQALTQASGFSTSHVSPSNPKWHQQSGLCPSPGSRKHTPSKLQLALQSRSGSASQP